MIGRSLRQYRVTALLGRGGMGEVGKPATPSSIGEVALKLLAAGDDESAAPPRTTVREAKAASSLNHPGIVTIYDIYADQGVDFIAMEYVAGRTLAKLIRYSRLTVDAAVSYALQIADAVGRAHHAGIVHRDLKPGNIMVSDDRRDQSPRLRPREYSPRSRKTTIWPADLKRRRRHH